MTFRADSLRGYGSGSIDYRLMRRHLINEYRRGRLALHQVCDAHPELVRAARQVGEPTSVTCPICEDANLVLVTYVFGNRLPPYGRCVTTRSEMVKLSRRPDPLTAYVVECCPECRWHHLARTFGIGNNTRKRSATP